MFVLPWGMGLDYETSTDQSLMFGWSYWNAHILILIELIFNQSVSLALV